MRPLARPGTREGMTAASGTAAPEDTGHGTDLNNRIPRTTPRLPFPAAHIIGLPAGHLKDASGAAPAAGLPPGP
jgi:hypothetical protein